LGGCGRNNKNCGAYDSIKRNVGERGDCEWRIAYTDALAAQRSEGGRGYSKAALAAAKAAAEPYVKLSAVE